MTYVQLALNLKGMSVEQKVTFGYQIKEAMDGNANFPNPFPSISDLEQALSIADDAIINAHPGDAASTAAMHDAEDELVLTLTTLMTYVSYVCKNDETKALSSGFSLKKPAVKQSKLLSAVHGTNSGEVDLQRKSVRGAAYKWSYCLDPLSSNTWVDAGTTTVASLTLKNLSPGKTYWFRTALVKGDTEHDWDSPVTLMVL